MIISKTPYRISFFGGGTDYPNWYLKNGGEVISATIDKYIYISCRQLPNFFEHSYRIVYSKIENVKNLSQIKHLVVREILKKSKIKHGLEIHYDGDMPARSGMGSSSSFVVGLINVINSFNKNKFNKLDLAKKSIHLEQKVLKETVGSQDQIAAAYGGLNSIKFFKNGKFKVTPLLKNKKEIEKFNKNFFLIFTGINRTAKFVAKTYVNKLHREKRSDLLKLINQVKIAKKLLIEKKYDKFGLLLNEAWKIKKNLSSKVSNHKIEKIYKNGIKSGASGGKLLGAGGGGFILFYVKKKNQRKFKNKMNKYLNIPFQFSNEGSKIIFEQKDA